VIFYNRITFFIFVLNSKMVGGRMTSLSSRNQVKAGNRAGKTIKKPVLVGGL